MACLTDPCNNACIQCLGFQNSPVTVYLLNGILWSGERPDDHHRWHNVSICIGGSEIFAITKSRSQLHLTTYYATSMKCFSWDLMWSPSLQNCSCTTFTQYVKRSCMRERWQCSYKKERDHNALASQQVWSHKEEDNGENAFACTFATQPWVNTNEYSTGVGGLWRVWLQKRLVYDRAHLQCLFLTVSWLIWLRAQRTCANLIGTVSVANLTWAWSGVCTPSSCGCWRWHNCIYCVDMTV